MLSSSALLLVFAAQTKLINFDEKCTHSSEIGKLGFKIKMIEDSAVDHQMAAAVPGSPEDQVDPTILRILSDLAKLPDGVEKQMLKRKLIQGVIAFTASQEDRERSSAAAAAPPQPPPPPPTRPSASSSSSSSSRAAENPSSPPAPPSNALDRWRRDKPQAAAEADAAKSILVAAPKAARTCRDGRRRLVVRRADYRHGREASQAGFVAAAVQVDHASDGAAVNVRHHHHGRAVLEEGAAGREERLQGLGGRQLVLLPWKMRPTTVAMMYIAAVAVAAAAAIACD